MSNRQYGATVGFLLLSATAVAQTSVPPPKTDVPQTVTDSDITQLIAASETTYAAGDFENALVISKRIAVIYRSTKGEKSPEYIMTLFRQARDLKAVGRIPEVEPLYRRALALRVEMLGEKHPSSIASVTQLAAYLDDFGRSREAEPLHRRALTLWAETVNEKDMRRIGSIMYLAANLDALGRSREAEPLHRRALSLLTESLGEKHPDAIKSLNNLAVNLDGLGRSREAGPLHRRALALRTEVLGEKHPDTISSFINLASNLYALGRAAEAEPLNRRALVLSTEVLGEKHPSTISSLTNLASILDALGRAAEAEPLNKRALALRTEVLGEKHPSTISSLANLASNLDALGRAAEAEPLNKRALALRTEVLGEKHPDTIGSLANLASNLDALGRAAEAEPLNKRALALRTEVLGEKHPDTITNLNNLASNLDNLGRAAEAEPLYRGALMRGTEVLGEKHPDTIASLGNLAGILDALGRSSEAEPLYWRALALDTELLGAGHPATVKVAYNLASSLLRQSSRASEALSPARQAVAGVRLQRSTLGASPREEGQRERDVRGQQGYFATLADADWSAGLARPGELPALRAEAFGALQDAMAGSTSQAVALMAARHAAEAAGAGLGEMARERQRLADEWRANEAGQTSAVSEGGPAAAVKRAGLRTRQTAIEGEMTRIDDRLRREAPAYFALIRPEPLAVADAQRLLGADEAVLLVVPTRFGTHVAALTREGLNWTRAAMTATEVNTAVARLRRDLDPGGAVRAAETSAPRPVTGAPAYDRQTAWRLYQTLVAPVAPALAGKRHVFVAADGALASLPFGVLVTAAPVGDDADPAALRATPWLADAHALVQLPSLQSLAFLRQFQARPGGVARAGTAGGFAGFGDPVLDGAAVTRGRGAAMPVTMAAVLGPGMTRDGGGIADATRLRELARLPGTATELEALRVALGAPAASVRMGTAATETAVRGADLRNARVVAFATHGLTAGQGGLAEPGLVLTPPAQSSETDDGLLSASEVTTLRLDADWVILSACNTAAGEGQGQPGLSGLARAFFYAGARSLLASHWPVRDDVAAVLTVDAIRRQRATPTLSRAEALQQAMQAVRNDTADPTRAHPAAWAPFTLVGDDR